MISCIYCNEDKMLPAALVMNGIYVGVWFCPCCHHLQDLEDDDVEEWAEDFDKYDIKNSSFFANQVMNNDSNPDFN